MPSSKFVKTCSGLLGLYFVGLGLMVAGFATDFWVDFAGFNNGLFKVCGGGVCTSITIGDQEDWFIATISLMIIGVAITVLGGATYMFVPVSGGLQIFGGLCAIIAVAIYGAEYTSVLGTSVSHLGWSLALAAAGGACVIINGITLLVLMSQEDGGMTMEMIIPGRDSKVGAA